MRMVALSFISLDVLATLNPLSMFWRGFEKYNYLNSNINLRLFRSNFLSMLLYVLSGYSSQEQKQTGHVDKKAKAVVYMSHIEKGDKSEWPADTQRRTVENECQFLGKSWGKRKHIVRYRQR